MTTQFFTMKWFPIIPLVFSSLWNFSYVNVSTARVQTELRCPDISEITTKNACVDEAPCSGNSPSNRLEWCCRNIFTDYESDVPNTGVTREYWLEVGQQYSQPDGYNRSTIAINGTIPGPTIFADWGDWVVIHVYNNITSQIRESARGVTLHWHGINQKGTNLDDGVPSITVPHRPSA